MSQPILNERETLQGKDTRRILLVFVILFALLSPLPFGLTDLDEGFYASVAREMVQSGNWLTPTLGSEPWFEKPPLLYWCMTFSMRILGINEFALRLPSVLAYLAVVGMLILWGERRLGAKVGWTAGFLFALSPLALLLGRFAITDMLLTCFFTIALIALWESTKKPAWSLMGGLATGCAILTKGPIGIGFIGLHWLFNARLLHAEGLQFRWVLLACVVALCVPVPWYAGIYLQHGGEFFEQFILKQNLLRFAGGDTAHSVFTVAQEGGLAGILGAVALYLLFYVVVYWLGMYPMSLFGFHVGHVRRFGRFRFFHSSSRRPVVASSPLPISLYLSRWFWLVFIFFTMGFTKLPAYIFPLFPAAALLIAYRFYLLEKIPFPAFPLKQGEGVLSGSPIEGEGFLSGSPIEGEGFLSGSPIEGEGFLSGSPIEGEGVLSGSPFKGEPAGGGTSSKKNTHLSFLTKAGLLLGGLLWLGVSVALTTLTRSPLPALFGAGLVWFAFSLTNFRNMQPAKLIPPALLILLGLHFSMGAYDDLFLKPPRQLAMQAPAEKVLVVYKVNPSLPSLRFYRAGKYAETSQETRVLEWLQQDAYCLTTDSTLQRKSDVQLVGQASAGGRTFYLLTGRYNYLEEVGSRE